jgi:hypothetical protein
MLWIAHIQTIRVAKLMRKLSRSHCILAQISQAFWDQPQVASLNTPISSLSRVRQYLTPPSSTHV